MKDITKHLNSELQKHAGETVEIPDGEFVVSDIIRIPAKTTLKGTVIDGKVVTRIYATGNGGKMFYDYPKNEVIVKNLTFKGAILRTPKTPKDVDKGTLGDRMAD